jgi:hypothetical protein
MKKTSINLVLGLLAGLFWLVPVSAMAADDPPPLAEVWLVTPKAGHLGEFQAAFQQHTAVRKENADPRDWQTFVSIVGKDINQFAIRNCCFNWADLDSFAKWDEANPQVVGHWYETVQPYVETVEHYYSEVDYDNSNWNDDSGPFRYFAVDQWKLKGGHEADFSAARESMSQIAINQGWANADRNWAWTTQIGGRAAVSLVVPHKNFAAMAGGEETFFEFLSKHMGSTEAAGALIKKFSASSWGVETTIWEHLPELSMGGDD